MAKYLKYLLIWLLILGLTQVKLPTSNKSDYFPTFWQSNFQYINEYSLGKEIETTTIENKNLKKGEYAWITSPLNGGTEGQDLWSYQVEYDYLKHHVIGFKLLNKEIEAVKMEPAFYTKGSKVELLASFNPKFSRYGVNCKGCSGQNSGHGAFGVGVGADINKGVRQFNGKYKKGLTFEGYYIVAADKALPYCTILKIDNHNFKGDGLTPGGTFYAVVLDRGGAIKRNRLDFYIGDEAHYNDLIKYSGRRKPLAIIVAFGKRSVDGAGKRSCKVPDIESLKENEKN